MLYTSLSFYLFFPKNMFHEFERDRKNIFNFKKEKKKEIVYAWETICVWGKQPYQILKSKISKKLKLKKTVNMLRISQSY